MDYQSSFLQSGYQNTSFDTSLTTSSKIDSLNASAKAIIAQKDAEIEELNRQIDEAEQFEAPSWSFPVPRVSRVSNGSFLSDLNEKYSVASVINDLRSKK